MLMQLIGYRPADLASQSQVYVEGWITDEKSNALPAMIQVVVNSTGRALTEPFPVNDGNYSAWTDASPYEVAVLFKSKGYKDQKVQFSTLELNPDVVMVKGGNGLDIPGWQIAIVIAAVALYMQKRKKVGAFTTSELLPIFLLAGGVIAFSIIKKVLESLGLWDSADTKALDNASDDPNSFWNPNYWQTIKPESAGWSYAIDETTARQWCAEIYNSFGPFNDCEECAIAVFKRCRTKANASFLAWEFQKVYGQDLLTFLRGGNWPQDRLSDADVNVINTFISNLPKY